MDGVSACELDARIEELHATLEQSQFANACPGHFPGFRALSLGEHMAVWDEVHRLERARAAMAASPVED